MSTLFTPGPWEISYTAHDPDTPRDHPDTFFVHYANDEGFGPTLLEGGLVLADEKQNVANAHLISAAPELFEAIEAMLRDWGGFRTPEGEKPESTKMAEDALAKARGEP